MPPKLNLLGQTFGRLTVVGEAENSRHGHAQWACLCECGNAAIILSNHLRRAAVVSCGCYRRESMAASHTTHGLHKLPEYRIWAAVIDRCTRPGNTDWHLYGGRGLSMCDRWRHSFENFLADMGSRPSRAHSIDRIDNNGNYEPGNCRWATPVEQRQNQRRVTAH